MQLPSEFIKGLVFLLQGLVFLPDSILLFFQGLPLFFQDLLLLFDGLVLFPNGFSLLFKGLSLLLDDFTLAIDVALQVLEIPEDLVFDVHDVPDLLVGDGAMEQPNQRSIFLRVDGLVHLQDMFIIRRHAPLVEETQELFQLCFALFAKGGDLDDEGIVGQAFDEFLVAGEPLAGGDVIALPDHLDDRSTQSIQRVPQEIDGNDMQMFFL